MKSPNFENCQIGLCKNGKIQKVSEKFASWVGQSSKELIGQNFRSLFLSLQKNWDFIIPKNFHRSDFESFFPLSEDSNHSSVEFISKIFLMSIIQ